MKLALTFVVACAITSGVVAAPIPIDLLGSQQQMLNSFVGTVQRWMDRRNEIIKNTLQAMRQEVDAVVGTSSTTPTTNSTNTVTAYAQSLTEALNHQQNTTEIAASASNSTK